MLNALIENYQQYSHVVTLLQNGIVTSLWNNICTGFSMLFSGNGQSITTGFLMLLGTLAMIKNGLWKMILKVLFKDAWSRV